jgi:hypothetical protein
MRKFLVTTVLAASMAILPSSASAQGPRWPRSAIGPMACRDCSPSRAEQDGRGVVSGHGYESSGPSGDAVPRLARPEHGADATR